MNIRFRNVGAIALVIAQKSAYAVDQFDTINMINNLEDGSTPDNFNVEPQEGFTPS